MIPRKQTPVRRLLSVFISGLLSSLPTATWAREEARSLKSSHQIALQEYLTAHPNLQFLPDRQFDDSSLETCRKSFGMTFSHYYRIGDFNRDGIEDFGVLLVPKEGGPVSVHENFADCHQADYDLAIVVFNGKKGGSFSVAFEEHVNAPLVSFLGITKEKRTQLYFATYETDANTMALVASGAEYVVKGDNEEGAQAAGLATPPADADRERKEYRKSRKVIMRNHELAKVVPRLEKAFVEGCRLLEKRAILAAAVEQSTGRDRIKLAYQVQSLDHSIALGKSRNGALLSAAAAELGLTSDDEDARKLMSFLQAVENCYCPTESEDRVTFGACTSLQAKKH